MSFVLGPPSSSGATTYISVPTLPTNLFTEVSGAIPVGKEALRLLGGQDREADGTKGGANAYWDEKIVIPVGITPQNLAKFTLYDILGFGGELGAAADIEAIRRAYHKAVLAYHPDKAQFKTADGKEDRTVFLKIQEAFNVLSSEPKRRAYDSQLPFDESIPSEERVQKAIAKGPAKVLKLFQAVFQRNARFAVKKPVPELGDMDTPIDQVYKFYEYWVNFESWRDFTGVGAEHKPEDAGSREEKRWMMKENERLAKKLKKKEMERLIALVTIAEKYDPRLIADKERRRLAKENTILAKENLIKQRQEEEAAATRWHEHQEEEEVAKQGGSASKADKEKIKKAAAKARNLIRKLIRGAAEKTNDSTHGEYGSLTTADVELLCSFVKTEELSSLCTALGGDAASKDNSLVNVSALDAVKAAIDNAKQLQAQAAEDEVIAREAKRREGEEKNIPVKKNAVNVDRMLNEDEKAALARAVGRYPAGTANRWHVVANYMNATLKPPMGEGYKPEEVLRAAYKMAISA